MRASKTKWMSGVSISGIVLKAKKRPESVPQRDTYEEEETLCLCHLETHTISISANQRNDPDLHAVNGSSASQELVGFI